MPIRGAAPFVAAAAWFALVLAGLAAAALHATEPPVWDALSYVQKALTFWQAIDIGKPFNPFDLPLTVRPPGTILMSYPFGWSDDFRWFYFRSCAIPVGLLMLAVFVGGWSRDATSRTRWTLTALALGLAGMPILYQFQFTDETWPASWGLVDGFLAGVAALAAAAVNRSAAARSIGWAVTAAALGAFCLLIKPSGLALMGLTGAAWLAISGQGWSWRALKESTVERRFVLISALTAMLIFAAVTAACFTSAYFSPENIAFGQRVLKVFGTGIINSADAASLFRKTFGYVTPVVILGGLVLAARSRSTRGAAVAATLCLVSGLWFWLTQTEVSQIRYFLPFATMAFVLLVPAVLHWAQSLSAKTHRAVVAVAVAPALLTAVLLVTPAPAGLQNALGINLTTNAFEPENNQAADFLNQLEAEGVKNATLYVTDTTPAMRNFISVATYPNLTAPMRPQVFVIAPVDWQTPNATRMEDLLRSDFVAFQPVTDTQRRETALAHVDVPDFAAETDLINAWLSSLTAADGIAVISETRVRLLRVTDRGLFDAALARLEQAHRWPPSYYAANPPRWWSATDLAARLKDQTSPIANVAFHRDNETVAALSLHSVETEILTAGGLRLNLWFERDPATTGEGWRIFAHLLDAKGEIIANSEKPLATDTSPDAEKTLRYQAVAFPNVPPTAVAVAFGFLRTDGATPAFLAADGGPRDWNGHRLIVPLPASR